MNMQETMAIMEVLKVSYPKFYSGMSQEDLKSAVSVWAMMFEDDDARIVTEAVKAMISTLKYPPTIADIKEKIRLLQSPEIMSEMEAWSLVYKAICNSGYDSENQFCKLPPLIQKIVGTPKQLREWGLTENLSMSVIQSNFMRSYKVMSEREEMISKLPDSCKNLITEKQEVNKICLNAKSAEEQDIFPM